MDTWNVAGGAAASLRAALSIGASCDDGDVVPCCLVQEPQEPHVAIGHLNVAGAVDGVNFNFI